MEFSYVSFFCEIFITPLTRSLVMEKKDQATEREQLNDIYVPSYLTSPIWILQSLLSPHELHLASASILFRPHSSSQATGNRSVVSFLLFLLTITIYIKYIFISLPRRPHRSPNLLVAEWLRVVAPDDFKVFLGV